MYLTSLKAGVGKHTSLLCITRKDRRRRFLESRNTVAPWSPTSCHIMIKDILHKGHLPTISDFDFFSYCLLHGITSLVMSQYGNLTYGPHTLDGPWYTAEARIWFIWLGGKAVVEWGWSGGEPDLLHHPYAMSRCSWPYTTNYSQSEVVPVLD